MGGRDRTGQSGFPRPSHIRECNQFDKNDEAIPRQERIISLYNDFLRIRKNYKVVPGCFLLNADIDRVYTANEQGQSAMTANNAEKVSAEKVSSRRKKAGSEPASAEATEVNHVEVKAMSGETAVENGSEAPKETKMSPENVVEISARPVPAEGPLNAIQLRQPVAMVMDRPVMPSEIEVAETITAAGVRPIAASHLQLAGSFLNGRPIEATSLVVHEMLPGSRPIFASDFKAVEGLTLLNNRPIMASDPMLMSSSMLPGGRPIASNDTVDPDAATLMGYLD